MAGTFANLLGTVLTTFKVGKSTLTAAGLSAQRTHTLQDVTGTLYQSGGTDVAVADGGTGASTAAGARTALNLDGINTSRAFAATHG